jgi:glycosyltransferase involved in cell wall biosynthesis
MQEWPKISVVTPSYNQAEFLERTIVSVLSQGYPNLEYIIIDGGSTDGSVDIIRKYADKLSYWISEKDKGQTDALNKGFRRCTGDIVAWLNSDDEYCCDSLKSAAREFMSDSSLDIVFGNRLTVDENGKILRDDRHTRVTFPALILYGQVISQPASFWKRSLFDKYGYLDESLKFCMDYEFYCRIGTNIKTKHIKTHLAKFRRHSSSKTCTVQDVFREEHGRIRKQYIQAACKGWPPFLVKLFVYISRSWWYCMQGDACYVLKGITRRMYQAGCKAIQTIFSLVK